MKIRQLRKYSREIKAYNIDELVRPTGNFYEAVHIIAQRADQINEAMTEDLQTRLESYMLEPGDSSPHEIEERTEIVSIFERLPKPHLVAIEEYLEGRLQWGPRRAREKAAGE